jgi:hypothetical protein
MAMRWSQDTNDERGGGRVFPGRNSLASVAERDLFSKSGKSQAEGNEAQHEPREGGAYAHPSPYYAMSRLYPRLAPCYYSLN